MKTQQNPWKFSTRRIRIIAGLCCAAFGPWSAWAGQPTVSPATEVSYRKQIFQDDRLKAYLMQIPPQHATTMHRHDQDMLTIVVSGGSILVALEGRSPRTDRIPAGDVRFRSAGFAHATRNVGPEDFRAVILAFARSQGAVERQAPPPKRYCSAGNSTVCVEEKHVLCTARFCVEEVRMNPGAVLSNLAVANDQMLVAVSDFVLAPEPKGNAAPGAPLVRASGEIQSMPAGMATRWKNTASRPAHFVRVVFRGED